jgi:hypothetical protein
MTDRICPTCGQPTPGPTSHDDIDPADALLREFKMTCVEKNYMVRAGRVSEKDATKLLGVGKRFLEGRRKSDDGPRVIYLPINGSRYSYELRELAAYAIAHGIGETYI